VISPIGNLPNARLLNGVTTVGNGSDYVLIADPIAGVVWRLNLETAQYDAVLNETATQPVGTFAADGGFGVNGVHAKNGSLYFTNTNLGFYRVPIYDNGTKAGDVEQLVNFTSSDDFTFDGEGGVYVARGAVDLISKITPAGNLTSLEYENPDALVLVEGNTAVKFGRTESDRRTLYVTTNGGYTGLVNGTAEQGGRVLAIDLDGSS